MAECPSCSARLAPQQTPKGVVYVCPKCGGRAAGLAVLRGMGAEPAFLRALWQKTLGDVPQVRRCPHCARPMAQITMPANESALTLDVCKLCESVWFDASEFQTMPREPIMAEIPVPEEEREKAALLKLKSIEERSEGFSGMAPGHGMQWLPGLLNLPAGRGAGLGARSSWATYGNVLGWLWRPWRTR